MAEFGLAEFWAAALALTLLLYVLLDGFDLGVGILFGVAPSETARRHMMQAISPVWDGNETWLVLAATILFGTFPLVYALLLSAFYLPLLLMLAALILRGVAFEFRYKALGFRWVWDLGFAGGSLLAAFAQGVTVGALVMELPVQDGRFAGGPLWWLSSFPLLCGVGLCLGYAMLGAAWLTSKTAEDVRDFGYSVLPWLLGAVLVFLVIAFGWSSWIHLRILDRWMERPSLLVLPMVGTLACVGMIYSVRRRIDWMPFLMAALVFLAAFLTLAGSFLPYIVPFSITIREAAAPAFQSFFHVLGRGCGRTADHVDLHARRLLGVQRQDRSGG